MINEEFIKDKPVNRMKFIMYGQTHEYSKREFHILHVLVVKTPICVLYTRKQWCVFSIQVWVIYIQECVFSMQDCVFYIQECVFAMQKNLFSKNGLKFSM